METLLPKTWIANPCCRFMIKSERIILNAIQSSDLQEGDRLPNERLLTEHL